MKSTIYIVVLTFFFFSCGSPTVNEKAEQKVRSEEVSLKQEDVPSTILTESVVTRMSKDFLHGSWQNQNHKDIDFLLHVNIVDDLVLGEYCSKAKDFFLEDCALEDEGGYCMIRGDMNQFNVELMMESCLNAELAQAFLRRENAELVLLLDKPAGEYGKDHLVPDTVQLKKISNEPIF